MGGDSRQAPPEGEGRPGRCSRRVGLARPGREAPDEPSNGLTGARERRERLRSESGRSSLRCRPRPEPRTRRRQPDAESFPGSAAGPCRDGRAGGAGRGRGRAAGTRPRASPRGRWSARSWSVSRGRKCDKGSRGARGDERPPATGHGAERPEAAPLGPGTVRGTAGAGRAATPGLAGPGRARSAGRSRRRRAGRGAGRCGFPGGGSAVGARGSRAALQRAARRGPGTAAGPPVPGDSC